MFFYYWKFITFMEFMLLVSVSMREYNFGQESCYEIASSTFRCNNYKTQNHNRQRFARNQYLFENQQTLPQIDPHRTDVGRKIVKNIGNDSVRSKVVAIHRTRRTKDKIQTFGQSNMASIRQNDMFERNNRNERIQRKDERIVRISGNVEKKYRYQRNIKQIRYSNQRGVKDVNTGNGKSLAKITERIKEAKIKSFIILNKHKVRLERHKNLHGLINLNIRKRHHIPDQIFRRLQHTRNNFAYQNFNSFDNVRESKLQDNIRQQARQGILTIVSNITTPFIKHYTDARIQLQYKFKQPYMSSDNLQDYIDKANGNRNKYKSILSCTPNAKYDLKIVAIPRLMQSKLGEYETIYPENRKNDEEKSILPNTGNHKVLANFTNPNKQVQYLTKNHLKNKRTDNKDEGDISVNKQPTPLSIKEINKLYLTSHCRAFLSYYSAEILQTFLLSFIVVQIPRGPQKLKNHVLQQLKQFLSLWNF